MSESPRVVPSESTSPYGDTTIDPDFDEAEEESLEAADLKTWMLEPEAFESFVGLESHRQVAHKFPGMTPSQFVEAAFRMPSDEGGYKEFSFTGRRHMRRPYDTPCNRVLLVTARQVEKTVKVDSPVLMSDGAYKPAGDVVLGDQLACLDAFSSDTQTTSAPVTWVSRRYFKPCLRVRTRRGHELDIATTHPVRQWGKWVEASNLQVGDRVAALIRAGTFYEEEQHPARVELTAFLLGDGYIGEQHTTFTGLPGAAVYRFRECLRSVGITYGETTKKGTEAVDTRVHANQTLTNWLQSDGLVGTKSATKFFPAWVFRLSREQTALFINRLWSTDGHVKQNTSSKYSIEYCSISRKMVRQLQGLLWKFGIPSCIRENWPAIYKRRGEKKLAYILRVESQDGIRTFLSQIGALGKSEHISPPTSKENNNRYTLPGELGDLIRKVDESRGRLTKKSPGSLFEAGLRLSPEYPLTPGKLARYVGFFDQDGRCDRDLLEELRAHLDSDIYWDVIESIEDLGEKECVDFMVEDHHNFIVDGVVTHNSTLLGNTALTYACLVPGFRTLYVSPSSTQTKTFSSDRLKEPIETSDILKAYTTNRLSMNVFEKQFINWSKITLRYAFLNADRVRGIPAWMLLLDELQDIIADNIPVIEQCTGHAPEKWRKFRYAGTPKSLDNVIEYYRANFSTQGEWAVPCDRCGSKVGAGRYWNILGERNIGKNGLICEKCGKPLYAQHDESQWAFMTKWDAKEAPFESYRIPQLMVPWKKWDEIILDYKRYPRNQFYNEVLGLSFDSGLRPLTMTQVKENCQPHITMHPDELAKYEALGHSTDIFAGIDWGSGENSYTVMTLAYYKDMKFTIFYVHRFTGQELEPPVQLEMICDLIRKYNVCLVGADYGGGFDRNDHLIRKFGPERVQKYQWMARCKNKVEWDPKLRRWKCHRTEVMSDIFNAIKRNQINFPRWEEFADPYAQDMCNIFSEYNESLKQIQYSHNPNRPDDTFHSLIYTFLVSMIKHRRPDIIAPRREEPGKGPSHGGGYTGSTDQG